jgi:transcriptional regulator with XRE-family HTH domain
VSDPRLTKLTGNVLVAVRDQVDYLINRGEVDREQLKLMIAPAVRKQIAKERAAEGKSQREIAAELGVSQMQISRDLAETKVSNRSPDAQTNVSTLDIPLDAPVARGQAEILRQAQEIRERQARLEHAARIERIAEISKANTALPGGARYPVILADPPWRYENPPMGGGNRSIENHYPTMTLEEICALPVGDLATDDAIL